MKDSFNSKLLLARYSKLVVLAVFLLILVGGHTTTSGAGMAFADWPLSRGSLNPSGWLTNNPERLEHSHRMAAESAALLIAILCSWIWSSKLAIPMAALVSICFAAIAALLGAPGPVITHLGLWSAVAVFIGAILLQKQNALNRKPPIVRALALAAFFGVCVQAILGGLRVTIESAGDPQFATYFRIFHACCAQIELCLVVAIATFLSPASSVSVWRPELARVSRFGWVTAGVIFLQLIAGASMRHLGAGLAISTFPRASLNGSWMPDRGIYSLLNFSHTRVGAIIVVLFVIWFATMALKFSAMQRRVVWPAALLLVLLVAQLLLGVIVVWAQRPAFLTTMHVVNGAALLATTVMLSVRMGRRFARLATTTISEPDAATISSQQALGVQT